MRSGVGFFAFVICTIAYIAVMGDSYKKDFGEDEGFKRCMRTAIIYGIVCGVVTSALLG